MDVENAKMASAIQHNSFALLKKCFGAFDSYVEYRRKKRYIKGTIYNAFLHLPLLPYNVCVQRPAGYLCPCNGSSYPFKGKALVLRSLVYFDRSTVSFISRQNNAPVSGRWGGTRNIHEMFYHAFLQPIAQPLNFKNGAINKGRQKYIVPIVNASSYWGL